MTIAIFISVQEVYLSCHHFQALTIQHGAVKLYADDACLDSSHTLTTTRETLHDSYANA